MATPPRVDPSAVLEDSLVSESSSSAPSLLRRVGPVRRLLRLEHASRLQLMDWEREAFVGTLRAHRGSGQRRLHLGSAAPGSLSQSFASPNSSMMWGRTGEGLVDGPWLPTPEPHSAFSDVPSMWPAAVGQVLEEAEAIGRQARETLEDAERAQLTVWFHRCLSMMSPALTPPPSLRPSTPVAGCAGDWKAVMAVYAEDEGGAPAATVPLPRPLSPSLLAVILQTPHLVNQARRVLRAERIARSELRLDEGACRTALPARFLHRLPADAVTTPPILYRCYRCGGQNPRPPTEWPKCQHSGKAHHRVIAAEVAAADGRPLPSSPPAASSAQDPNSDPIPVSESKDRVRLPRIPAAPPIRRSARPLSTGCPPPPCRHCGRVVHPPPPRTAPKPLPPVRTFGVIPDVVLSAAASPSVPPLFLSSASAPNAPRPPLPPPSPFCALLCPYTPRPPRRPRPDRAKPHRPVAGNG